MTTTEVKRNNSAKRMQLGAVRATRRAQEEIPFNEVFRALGRHFVCDWGDFGPVPPIKHAVESLPH
jgi:hypothetical protein